MNSRRLRWRGPAQQARIAEELERQLGLWLQGWSVEAPWLSLAGGDASAIGDLRWLHARSGNCSAWIGASADDIAQLGARLAGVDERGRQELGARIGARALKSLLAQCLGVETPEFEHQAPAPEELQSRFGGQRFRVHGRGFAAALVLDAGACDRFAPPASPAKAALVSRSEALGREPINLEVRLGLGEAPLSETHALQVGDVLVSGTRLDSLFQLVHPDSRPLATGRLRRDDRRLAFSLQSATNPSSKPA